MQRGAVRRVAGHHHRWTHDPPRPHRHLDVVPVLQPQPLRRRRTQKHRVVPNQPRVRPRSLLKPAVVRPAPVLDRPDQARKSATVPRSGEVAAAKAKSVAHATARPTGALGPSERPCGAPPSKPPNPAPSTSPAPSPARASSPPSDPREDRPPSAPRRSAGSGAARCRASRRTPPRPPKPRTRASPEDASGRAAPSRRRKARGAPRSPPSFIASAKPRTWYAGFPPSTSRHPTSPRPIAPIRGRDRRPLVQWAALHRRHERQRPPEIAQRRVDRVDRRLHLRRAGPRPTATMQRPRVRRRSSATARVHPSISTRRPTRAHRRRQRPHEAPDLRGRHRTDVVRDRVHHRRRARHAVHPLRRPRHLPRVVQPTQARVGRGRTRPPTPPPHPPSRTPGRASRPKAKPRRRVREVPVDRLVGVPTHSRHLLLQGGDLTRERRRGHRLREDSQPAPQVLLCHREECVPRVLVPRVGRRARAVRVVEPQKRRLRDRVRRSAGSPDARGSPRS